MARARRAGLDPLLGTELARCVLDEAPPPAGAIVAGFWPMNEEIDIRPLLDRLIERRYVVVLPVTPHRGEALHFRRWQPGDVLLSEPFGTFAPTGEALTPDFLFVPLLAFDRRGHRLGYGGGFYDRTLATMPGAGIMGCAYACQEMAEVPAGPGDVRLPAVATERGIIRCIWEP
ncbi:MAG: 5-formyltetrahydrofolate cyclo-ligase [Acetobacteraceae bacterium]